MIFLTSDNHFFHTNIIKYTNRPFSSVEEMNMVMIQNWNAVVQPKDTVYQLGDFFLTNKIENIIKILEQLHGQIFLVPGSHDNINLYKKALSSCPNLNSHFSIISNNHVVKYNDIEIVLNHYSMRVWPKSHYGSFHLFGHSHGHLNHKDMGKSFDVGVDCFNFYPISIDKVIEIMKTKPDNFNMVNKHE